MSFEERIALLAKEFYSQVSQIVEDNKRNDDKIYKSLYLRLPDGRSIEFNMQNSLNECSELCIHNYHCDRDTERCYGDYLSINPDNPAVGFYFYLNVWFKDRDELNFFITEDGFEKIRTTEEEEKIIEEYMNKLMIMLPFIQYDETKTHVVDNLLSEEVGINTLKKMI